MAPGKFHRLRVAGLLLVTASSLFAGNFAPPAEGPVAFRRDQLPLDSDTMSSLSRQLVILAGGLKVQTAVNRRTAAQMLALSTALDPANVNARELISTLERDEHPALVNPAQLAESQERVWQLLAWLETPEAGGHGQALAACLTDIILVSDPEHPRAEAMRGTRERGTWTGWIPQLSAYQIAEPEPPKATAPKETVAAQPATLLTKARVFTPLWKKSTARTDANEPVKWVLSPAPLEMKSQMIAGDGTKPPPFSMVVAGPANIPPAANIPAAAGGASFARLGTSLVKILEKQHGSLPAGGRVTIGSDEFAASALSSKPPSFSAAAAVLASAAISGREPGGTIIGLVDENGAFKLPLGFWEQLQALDSGPGGRLVLPAAAAEYLPAMLAFEKPGFFLEYEVLLASNFQELLDLTAKTPTEPLAKASTQFQEIHEKARSQPLGSYLANPFVRRRLQEISQAAPFHYSAKMLAIQGAGNRPIYLTRPVLMSELQRAIEPMEWLTKRGLTPFLPEEVDSVGTSFEICRSQVDHLLRYTDKADRKLADQVLDMVVLIRPLDRAARARPDPYEFSNFSAAQQSAYRALLEAHAAVAAALRETPAETEPARDR